MNKKPDESADVSGATPDPTDIPYLVCLGASAGGLEALEAFFTELPADTGAAFVTIVHLSPDFKSLMPELLQRHSNMEIQAACDGIVPRPNTIYIIPPGKNMVYRDGRICLEDQDRTPGHALNLPIDIFLKSLARGPAHRMIAVILSGTGSDGSRGIRELKDAGGIVLVQDPESAKFDGMPRSALDSGVVDATADPKQLARKVASIVDKVPDYTASIEIEDEHAVADDMAGVLDVLRAHFKLDLSYLRPSMLHRRVRRRMALLGISAVASYVEKLKADVAEAQALRQDTFIGVTGFFRDKEAFARLQRHLATEMLPRAIEGQFRIWVPACATGEEVYSLAILALEAMEAAGIKRELKIFATDIDEESLARASKATYPTAGIAEIGPVRLSKYFIHNGDTVTIKPAIRELVICAQHNLVTDPPFTKIDLVSCRNFLIYLEQPAQESVLASLHFALKTGGTVFLGSAEAMGRLGSEFEVVDSKFKLFRKTRSAILPSMRRRAGLRDPVVTATRSGMIPNDRDRDASIRQLLDTVIEKDGKSAAVVGLDGNVIEILGDPLGIFQVPKGKITTDIMRMVSDDVTAALTTGIQRLRREGNDVQYAIRLNGPSPRHVTIKLLRLPAINSVPERIVIIIEPSPSREIASTPDQASLDKDTTIRMNELQLELQQTRESLQATIEELQSSNEEQQSTNEELVASNEELQSTNEELQSVNEELYTINVEYQSKIQELAVLAADLDNLLRNIDIGTLFLDTELRIRKFTPAIDQIIKLMEHDVGRSIEHFAHNLGTEFLSDVRNVISSGNAVERELRGTRGNWLMVRILPYMAHSGQQSGVVVTFIDVTAIKNAEEMTRMANDQLAFANRELSRQREELEDLFSIVAHDLKRPVAALDGLLKLINAETNVPDRESKDEEILSKALGECGRMKRMLVDLAHVSGLTRRETTKDEVDLQAWLDQLVDRFREDAESRGVRINCICDAGRVQIGRAFLEEAFVNLIENALKYGTTDKNPRIDITCLINDGALELSVRDNGKGIAPENHQKIFEPFRRLDPDLSEGSGIGLVAARRLITRYGGVLSVQSALGEGAKFIARIPIEDLESRKLMAPKKPRVLLVEDDMLDAKTVQRYLGDDFSTTCVKGIAEAESRLGSEIFDLVILDLSLPDGHGFQLVRRIRTVLGSQVPIVVVTGQGEGIAPKSISATIAGFLSKVDVQRESLLKTVNMAIQDSANGGSTLN
ncbi:MAG TPA: chemotaxis protein CheB [Phycisphaerae bacterium]|nr:chemotaxis protein CheB [Phycisphaerae bacterium]